MKNHKKAEYTILFMNKELNKHLKEMQEIAQSRVNELVKQLKEKSNLTESIFLPQPFLLYYKVYKEVHFLWI